MRPIQINRIDPFIKIGLVLFVFLGLSIHGMAQSQFKHYKTIDEPIRFFTTDPFKNIYAINDKEELLKFDEQGTLLFRFGIRELGPIQIVDASNPFKVIVFYEETNQLVVLDNNLSEISRTDLFDLNILSVSAISNSSNDEIWFFDRFNQQLIRLNNQLEISYKGEQLNETFDQQIEPHFMLEKQDAVYLNDSTQGIFVFDLFGNYQKTIRIKGLASFQVVNNLLVYLKDGQLKSRHLKLLSNTYQMLPADRTPSSVRIHDQRLYVLDSKRLHLYSF